MFSFFSRGIHCVLVIVVLCIPAKESTDKIFEVNCRPDRWQTEARPTIPLHFPPFSLLADKRLSVTPPVDPSCVCAVCGTVRSESRCSQFASQTLLVAKSLYSSAQFQGKETHTMSLIKAAILLLLVGAAVDALEAVYAPEVSDCWLTRIAGLVVVSLLWSTA